MVTTSLVTITFLVIVVPIITATGIIVWKAIKDKKERERENMRLFDNITEGNEDE